MKAVRIKDRDSRALTEFKSKVVKEFPEARFILFGSKVRGQDDEFSDLDVLVILNRKISTDIEKEIFGIGFEVGLSFSVVFGIIVEENRFWNSSLAKAMPFYQNVAKQGVII